MTTATRSRRPDDSVFELTSAFRRNLNRIVEDRGRISACAEALGVTEYCLAGVMLGRINPSMTLCCAICRWKGITLAQLFGRLP